MHPDGQATIESPGKDVRVPATSIQTGHTSLPIATGQEPCLHIARASLRTGESETAAFHSLLFHRLGPTRSHPRRNHSANEPSRCWNRVREPA